MYFLHMWSATVMTLKNVPSDGALENLNILKVFILIYKYDIFAHHYDGIYHANKQKIIR